MADGLQKRLQSEVEKYQNSQKDLQKYVTTRQRLDAQLSENMLVKDELDSLEASANVYKLIGPILVKQDLEEGKQTVQKRIDYINGEIKRHDGIIKEMEKKQDSQRETLAKLQHQFQQAQVKAAARA
ncbi:prefoldin subunit 6-like [Gigantopelta aegis]|uniref:prefoldin subunit 6-like n=1 Tax=Gigantopelta aegis TaxID=1735272 RepID=UPI001B88AB76|nr:prefoldin subunit 6-like [Gigantopelta aegis]